MRDVLLSMPAAEGYERVGWRGLALMVPKGWNLRLFDGDEKVGALFFADLRATRLEVRWRRLKGRGGMERSIARLRQKKGVTAVREMSGGAVRVEFGEAVFVLAGTGERLYEFHWPRGEEGGGVDCVSRMMADFRWQTGRAVVEGREERYWSVYGARGWVSAEAKLKTASLLPGETRLVFAGGGEAITLGAVSLADRILREAGSLQNWGTKMPVVAGLAGGRWEECEAGAVYMAERRGWLRRMFHRLELRHDVAGNRICWTHRRGRKSG